MTQTPPATPPPAAVPSPAALPSPAAPLDQPSQPRTQSELENEFRDLLNGAVLTGSFRMIGKGMGREDATLSEPIVERYVIEEASKVLEDSWMIKARIQYGDKDVTVPVIVRVVWAGDTPVITLDQASIPLIGSYSARVMVYRGFYSGAWFGAGYSGVMSGQITRLADEPRKPATTGAGERSPEQAPKDSGQPQSAQDENTGRHGSRAAVAWHESKAAVGWHESRAAVGWHESNAAVGWHGSAAADPCRARMSLFSPIATAWRVRQTEPPAGKLDVPPPVDFDTPRPADHGMLPPCRQRYARPTHDRKLKP
ncbi:MAG: hypothetical protein IT449_10310 [Phycisphaerales bacterium]|nr:hypothetical protein [Phycisphaerales bacterium]